MPLIAQKELQAPSTLPVSTGNDTHYSICLSRKLFVTLAVCLGDPLLTWRTGRPFKTLFLKGTLSVKQRKGGTYICALVHSNVHSNLSECILNSKVTRKLIRGYTDLLDY